MAKKLPPVHPGEILREEFLVPLKLTPYAVAAALNVPRTRIERGDQNCAGPRLCKLSNIPERCRASAPDEMLVRGNAAGEQAAPLAR